MTLLELAPFLTDLGFRTPHIERTQNAEVKAYFRSRYEQLSDAMQTVVREAILNKASAFTTDPAIRHIVGQQTAFELSDALERGQWVILQMDKSRLGEDAEVLASLILARFKNAIFARKARTLFTLYADEVQNLVSSSDTFEHLLSEARKFGVSVVTANQHLGQYPAQVRATLLSSIPGGCAVHRPFTRWRSSSRAIAQGTYQPAFSRPQWRRTLGGSSGGRRSPQHHFHS
jgi:hypothetical protein